MVDAILRIVPLLQLLEARVIFCTVISRWPIRESKVRIVCVMACDSGLRNMIAHPTYRFSKNRCARGGFPVSLRLTQVRESAMWIGAFHVVGNGAAESIDLKNQSRNSQDLFENTGQRLPNVVDSFVISGAGVFNIDWTLLSIIPGQGSLQRSRTSRGHFCR